MLGAALGAITGGRNAGSEDGGAPAANPGEPGVIGALATGKASLDGLADSGPQPGDPGFIGALATGRVDGEVSVNGLSPGDPGFIGALASGNPNAGPGNNSGGDGEGSETGEGEVEGEGGTETVDLSGDD